MLNQMIRPSTCTYVTAKFKLNLFITLSFVIFATFVHNVNMDFKCKNDIAEDTH